MRKTALAVFLLAFVSNCFAALVMMKDGKLYDAESIDPGYSPTQIKAVVDGKTIYLNRSDISSFENMPASPVKAESIKVEMKKPDEEKAVKAKATPEPVKAAAPEKKPKNSENTAA